MNIAIPYREKNIVFIGFMGVGKTTIGKLVAEKLYRTFIDIDEEIVKAFDGMTIPEIFKFHGEKVFREKEKELIFHYNDKRLKVISVGGGAFMQEEIRQQCLEKSIVIFLDASFESWEKRIDLLIESRPVLQNRSIIEIEELFNKRQSIYQQHQSRILTDHQSPEEAADYIINALKSAWSLHD